ncbi:MAG: hypothetical protein KDA84_14660, partial [Planctomycetaceae bacterium]|nr:hypothetical protein [Planctomycetaceae bacterium]
GVHSLEQSPSRASGWLSPFLRAGVCGLALTAGILGTNSSAQAEHRDPTKPRIERVRDVDGSMWEVLIVPRPLYPATPGNCPIGCEPPLSVGHSPKVAPANEPPILPPAPKEHPEPKAESGPKSKAEPKPKAESKPKPEPKPKAEPKPAKPSDPPKAKEVPPIPPPPPQKVSPKEEQAGTLPSGTEWVSLDDTKTEASEPASEDVAAAANDGHDLGVQIVPRFAYRPVGPASNCCAAESHHQGTVNPADYWRVYRSIPFLRSEYVANPSYRHEATMEILLGQLRPVVAPQIPAQPRPHHTMFPFENDFVRPNSFYSLSGSYGPGLRPGPYAFPGAYGMNLNYPGAQLSRVPWGFTIPYDLTPGY